MALSDNFTKLLKETTMLLGAIALCLFVLFIALSSGKQPTSELTDEDLKQYKSATLTKFDGFYVLKVAGHEYLTNGNYITHSASCKGDKK